MESQISSATDLFLYLIGMLWTWTQKETLSKLSSSTDEFLSKLWVTTSDLSKLYGSVERILPMSSLLSKMKRTLWSPSLWILNPFFARHRGLKVLATTSMFNARRIKKKAAIIYSLDCRSFLMQRSSPSLSERERQFHCLVRSSIGKTREDKKKETEQGNRREKKRVRGQSLRKKVFPHPTKKKNQLALRVTLLRRGKTILTRRNNNSTA